MPNDAPHARLRQSDCPLHCAIQEGEANRAGVIEWGAVVQMTLRWFEDCNGEGEPGIGEEEDEGWAGFRDGIYYRYASCGEAGCHHRMRIV
jgi:hypothetical protein